jgi:hypothetical protein
MATRRPLARNNHLEEAMALLIRNQAGFVEQIARNDQERLALKEWQQKTETRLEKIEVRLVELSTVIEHLPKIIVRDVLDKLPKAVKKEIGFKSPAR